MLTASDPGAEFGWRGFQEKYSALAECAKKKGRLSAADFESRVSLNLYKNDQQDGAEF
jgi:hypothetical protein